MKDMAGPSTREQWLYWQYKTPEHNKRGATLKELEKLITPEVVIYLCAFQVAQTSKSPLVCDFESKATLLSTSRNGSLSWRMTN